MNVAGPEKPHSRCVRHAALRPRVPRRRPPSEGGHRDGELQPIVADLDRSMTFYREGSVGAGRAGAPFDANVAIKAANVMVRRRATSS